MLDLFLRVIDVSLTAACVVLAVLLLRLPLRRAPRGLLCLLWITVALRLLLPFSIESEWSLVPKADSVSSALQADTVPSWGDFALPNGTAADPSAVGQQVPAPSDPVIDVPTSDYIHSTYPSPALPTDTSPTPLQVILSAAPWIWLGGAALMLLYAATSYLRVRRSVREAVPDPSEQGVWRCDHIPSPFILGSIRPRIYLPSSLSARDATFVLAHEHAHLRRLDHLTKPFAFLLLCVHWFNPLLWIAYVLLCRDIELACDERVIRTLGAEGKQPYSDALINCSAPRHALAVCPLAFAEVGIGKRVRSVLDYKKPTVWIILAALLALAVLAVCFLTDPVGDEEERVPFVPGEICRRGELVYFSYFSSEADTSRDEYFSVTEDMRTLLVYRDGGYTAHGTLTKIKPGAENLSLSSLYYGPSRSQEAMEDILRISTEVYRIDCFDPLGHGAPPRYLLLTESGNAYVVKGHRHSVFRLDTVPAKEQPPVCGIGFYARVIAKGGSTLLTLSEEMDGKGTLLYVSTALTSGNEMPAVDVGDHVYIVYDGTVLESYPGQIRGVYDVVLSSEHLGGYVPGTWVQKTMDIDRDGQDELCITGEGPTLRDPESGELRTTFTLTVKNEQSGATEYFGVFYRESDFAYFNFYKHPDGSVDLTSFRRLGFDENGIEVRETVYYGVSFDGNDIVLSCDDGEAPAPAIAPHWNDFSN